MHRIKRHTPLALFIFVVIVGFVLSPSIGPSWDEPDNIFSAGVYVNFFTRGFDPSYFTFGTAAASSFGDRMFTNDYRLSHYPPLQNYAGSLITGGAQLLGIKVTAPVIIIAFHWATVLFFALTVAMTYRFALLLGISAGSSVFAALAVFLYPQLFGHGLSNIKDTAQVALVVTSLYYLVKKNLLIGAVVWGLGMATKFNAIYVPIIWGIWQLIIRKQSLLFIIRYSLFIIFIGCITAVAVWPFLWFDTFARVVEVVKYFTTVGQGYRVIWNGVWYVVGTGKSLWWYPIAGFLYTTPLLLLALMFFGIARLFGGTKKHPVWIILPIWILVPFLRTISPWSAFYDLTRHFMEIIPATVILAAIGLEWFFQKKQQLHTTGIMLGAIIVGQLIFINVLYFPYSTGYYNLLARDPNVNFDRDIEALSVKEAMDYVHKQYGNVRVFFPIGGHQSWYYLKPGDQYVYIQQEADVVILVNKASHFRIKDAAASLPGYLLVHQISRGDAIFAWIYKKN